MHSIMHDPCIVSIRKIPIASAHFMPSKYARGTSAVSIYLPFKYRGDQVYLCVFSGHETCPQSLAWGSKTNGSLLRSTVVSGLVQSSLLTTRTFLESKDEHCAN